MNLLFGKAPFIFILSLLRECSRGILIESYFPHMLEVRIVSIFGTVIVGGTDSGLKIDRLGSMLKGTSQQWIK